jgi:chitinase
MERIATTGSNQNQEITMFTTTNTFSIISSAVRSRAARFSALLLLAGVLTFAQPVTGPVAVGYYLGSSSGGFPLSNLTANGSAAHLTHLNYAFADIVTTANLSPNAKNVYSCALHDPADETGPSGTLQKLKQLKAANPNLKVLISIGGAVGSSNFPNASSEQYVDAFAQSCVNLFIGGQFATSTPTTPGLFDGIDIDWEFPTKTTTGQPNIQYTRLLEAFQNQLSLAVAQQHLNKHFLLTSAISPNNGPDGQLQYIDLSNTNANGATHFVDFFNVMTYDYAGSWNTAPTSTAPLSSIEANIADLMSQGVPASKLVLGVPFYGVDYSAEDKFSGDSGGTALSTLLSQAYSSPVLTTSKSTQDTNYADIMAETSGATVQYDGSGSAWAFDPATQLLWVYDDANTIQAKGVWANSQHLLGMMTWDITKDSQSGTLLCALETATVGSVCTGTQPPPPLFDFEGGVSGWMTTGQVYTIAGSTAQAYTGKNSMAVNFNSAQGPTPPGTVWTTPPAAVKAGSTISFEVYVPSASLSNLTDISAFFMDAKWAWTSTTVSASNLKANAWNQISVTVPANAVATFTEIGLQFDSVAAWTGTIYVDSVTMQ